jgi:Beta-galactosidase/beta-glucuronidase
MRNPLNRTVNLLTPFGEKLDKSAPLPEYPRPQLKRDSYINLNGEWDYAIYPSDADFMGYTGKILVPFSPESVLSGVNRILRPSETLYYRRFFALPEGFNKGKVLLNFGAIDYKAEITVNGKAAGSHAGGYFPFSLDISSLLKEGENALEVSVTDPTDCAPQARGKQKLHGGGIFYTPQSGIWQTVWLESVPENYIKSLKITPDIDAGEIKIIAGTEKPSAVSVKVFDGKKLFASGEGVGEFSIKLPGFKLWSPESPKLYDLKVTAGSDTVSSYFGMRKYGLIKDDKGIFRLALNNKPYFHNGLLDQGYWPDGLYTPPSEEAMLFDLKTAKEAGFNMLRKHIKVEPLRWYYHCDRLGILVWQDMVSGGGATNNIVASGLGFFGFRISDKNYRLLGRSDAAGRLEYYKDTAATVNALYNSVSVCLWVPFNESWGQFDSEKAYNFIKQMDATRPIDHASGWHDQGIGDFRSLHIYFKKIRLPKREKRSVILSEFGGYALNVEGHVFNLDHEFGYKKFATKEALWEGYEKLFKDEIVPLLPKGLSAAVYTQLTDVEDEINGLLTYDRKVLKVDIEKLKELNSSIKY